MHACGPHCLPTALPSWAGCLELGNNPCGPCRRVLHQTVVIGFAVLACGPGLFRLISRQIVVTESSYLVLPMFVAAVCLCPCSYFPIPTQQVLSFSNYLRSAGNSPDGGRCGVPSLPGPPSAVELFVLRTVSIDSCTFGLTLMSPRCQGLWSGNYQEGLRKRKLFPRAGRNAISWLEN